MSEGGQPDLGAMVSKLLGDPELLSQIASTVGINAPAAASGNAPGEVGSEPKDKGGASTAGVGSVLPALSMLGGGGSGGNASRRCALLSALKPFCNEHRSRTIDYMIGISKLSDTLMQKRG